MPLRESHGNMYDWVSHVHTHLGGECPHRCSYCYVRRGRSGWPERYRGSPRLIASELAENYGEGKVIFIEHMGDLFADEIPDAWIELIIAHCRRWPSNKYVWQTKNPGRAVGFKLATEEDLLGVTIETNRDTSNVSRAPSPFERFKGIREASNLGRRVFVTIEPILDFDVYELASWIREVRPEFVNIGADSKACDLEEPPWWKVGNLIVNLIRAGIAVRVKTNLNRLRREGAAEIRNFRRDR